MTITGTVKNMGTPLPIIAPPVPGILCPNCWGIDGLFGPGPTPSKINILFEGIEKDIFWLPGDGEPPNGVFEAVQREGIPCSYGSVFGPLAPLVTFFTTVTSFSIRSSTGELAFSRAPVTPCLLTMPNSLVGKFHLGTGTVLF